MSDAIRVGCSCNRLRMEADFSRPAWLEIDPGGDHQSPFRLVSTVEVNVHSKPCREVGLAAEIERADFTCHWSMLENRSASGGQRRLRPPLSQVVAATFAMSPGSESANDVNTSVNCLSPKWSPTGSGVYLH